MACERCATFRREDYVPLGEDLEDGIGEWSMERLSDGVINLAYSEGNDILASLEISYCPFCGQKLA